MSDNDQKKRNDAMRKLDERLLELTALFEISRSLASSLSIRAILENVLRIPMGHMLISRGLILLRRTEEEEYVVEELKGLTSKLIGKSLIIDTPPSRSVFVSDVEEETDWIDFFKKFEIELLLPLISSKGIIGILGFGKKISGKPYEEGEVEFLNSLSNIAAGSVVNGLMVDEIQNVNRSLDRKVQHLNTIFDISRELNTTLDQRKIASLLSFAVMGEMMVNKCIVFTKVGGRVQALVSKGIDPLVEEVQELCEIAEPLLLEDSNRFGIYKEMGIAALVPMRIQDETKGVLAIGPKISNVQFDDGDLEFLKTLGNQAMTSLENARLFEETLEKQRMEEELNLARNMQQALLPSNLPLLDNYEIAAVNIPSREVGGDYYDVIKISEELYGISIADVSGKGAGAALLMSNLQASLNALASGDMKIGEMVGRINNLIHKNTDLDKYITFFYGQLNVKANTFVFCNAGHNPPYKVKKSGKSEELFAGGIVLGMMSDMEFEIGEVALQKGDRIVMFTDGITEAMDQMNEEYGEERLKNLISETYNLSAQEILEKIVSDVKTFTKGAPQSDDITLLVLKAT